MTDELERRWDDAMEQACARYRRDLADGLAALAEGASVSVALPDREADEASPPSCRVTAWPGDRLRVEVVGDRSSAEDAALLDLGFEAPGDGRAGSLGLDLERREADRAAWTVVAALRTVYGVLHPVYLDPGATGATGATEEPPAGTAPPALDATFPPDHAGPWTPRDDADVRGAVTRVVRDLLDDEPEWDEDGDLPLHTDRAVRHVVVAREVPRILLSATLLTDVVDESSALVELNLLNRRNFGLAFALDGGRVVVRRELPVSTFVPREIRAEISRLCDGLDGWTDELQVRVGGRAIHDDRVATPQHHRAGPVGDGPAAVDEAERERFQAAYDVMTELEAEERGSLDPATLVRVFHGDRALLMAAIGHTRRRETDWRGRAKTCEASGDVRGARSMRGRARYLRELRSRLRRALRITVRAARRHDVPEQLALFAQDDAAG